MLKLLSGAETPISGSSPAIELLTHFIATQLIQSEISIVGCELDIILSWGLIHATRTQNEDMDLNFNIKMDLMRLVNINFDIS